MAAQLRSQISAAQLCASEMHYIVLFYFTLLFYSCFACISAKNSEMKFMHAVQKCISSSAREIFSPSQKMHSQSLLQKPRAPLEHGTAKAQLPAAERPAENASVELDEERIGKGEDKGPDLLFLFFPSCQFVFSLSSVNLGRLK